MITEFKIFENNRADLYHAIKTKYANIALEKNELDIYSYQRYWANGKRYKDNEPEYKNSFFYRGLSLTRDINYAKNWASVILVFDTNKLKEKYKIVPYNWGFSIGNITNQNIKKEKEEFLIVSYNKNHLTDKEFINMYGKSGGSIKNLSYYLKGFYINKSTYNIYTENDTKIYEPYEKLKKNKLYLGLL